MKPQPNPERLKLRNVVLFNENDSPQNSTTPNTIPISKIVLPNQQPRRYFDPEKMITLVESVRKHGILEPILLRSLDNNTYDGHTLKSALTNAQKITQTKIDDAFVDKGYKGHGIDEEIGNIIIFISGKRTHNGKKLTKTLKKHLKRRQAIEPIIGHMKNDGKLNLSRLKGVIGDKINAVLAACGHNLRMILKHIKKLLKNSFFVSSLAFFTAFLREIMGFYQEFRMKFSKLLVLEFGN